MATDEIWKPIPGYEGYYDVSNRGRVRSLVRKSKYGVLSERKTPRINSMSNRRGYYMTWLYKEGEGKHWLVHRLVALAFIPNPNNLPFVNHKDENPKNNRFDNLEWCSRQYNNNYGNRLKRVAKSLSKGYLQYDTEGNLIAEFDTAKQAQESTGIYYTSIKACCIGRYHTAGGYIWRHRNEPLHNNIRS